MVIYQKKQTNSIFKILEITNTFYLINNAV